MTPWSRSLWRSCLRSILLPGGWSLTRRPACSARTPAARRAAPGFQEVLAVRIDIITIFPEYFSPLGVSLIGKAAQRGDIAFAVHDLRSWTTDIHHSVDDAPFGGGPGMVMRPG